jgi:acetyltransferase-like isoleucine patch superfamily enzyme
MTDNNLHIMQYRQQHKKRLSYMPWLYHSLKPEHKEWAEEWQMNIQNHLRKMETVEIGKGCFIAPEAQLFAEPGRPIVLGDFSYIAAECVIHGPIEIGKNVSINHHVTLDGGRKGIRIGNYSRIAAYTSAYAFNHGMEAKKLIQEQAITSLGIEIGEDVWIGANVGIVDGVTIGDKSIIGMGSVVTKSVTSGLKVAGNPAKEIGYRVASFSGDFYE